MRRNESAVSFDTGKMYCPTAAGTNYVETLRVQLHANCRIRRIYFSDRLYTEEELPAEFKLYTRSAASAAALPPPMAAEDL